MEPAETCYVRVGDADVAYQVVGKGPYDLLFATGLGATSNDGGRSQSLPTF